MLEATLEQVYHERLEEDDIPYDSVHPVKAFAFYSRAYDLVFDSEPIRDCDGIRECVACREHEYMFLLSFDMTARTNYESRAVCDLLPVRVIDWLFKGYKESGCSRTSRFRVAWDVAVRTYAFPAPTQVLELPVSINKESGGAVSHFRSM